MSDDPYEILGVDRQAGEEEVRRRYLELVRQHPPDRDPGRFAQVREAYEHLRDPVVRVEKRLFDPETTDSLDRLTMDLRGRLRSARIPTKLLLELAERS
jgi:curved DNA-binding protein CbpA